MSHQPMPIREDRTNLYARDGRCHNAEPGTYGHECSKPATWLGKRPSGWWCGYCADCRERGTEARACVAWEPIPNAT